MALQEIIDQGVKEQPLLATRPETNELQEVTTEGPEIIQIENRITKGEDTKPELTKASFPCLCHYYSIFLQYINM